MAVTEAEQRAAVIAEARTWLRTPYHHAGRVKGAGVDCGQLLIEVYSAVGLIPHFETGHYPSDWALHRETERYMGFVAAHAKPTESPGPGDLVLWKFGRCFSHGAIIVDWPTVIHAQRGVGCVLTDALKEQALVWVGDAGAEKPRERLFFTLWG